jgi:exosortase/archaeosortase family protein
VQAKLWFIPLGLMLIFMINVFRLLALILIQAHYNSYFDFAHDYLYVVVTYSLIFVLVMWWMNRWAFATDKSEA